MQLNSQCRNRPVRRECGDAWISFAWWASPRSEAGVVDRRADDRNPQYPSLTVSSRFGVAVRDRAEECNPDPKERQHPTFSLSPKSASAVDLSTVDHIRAVNIPAKLRSG